MNLSYTKEFVKMLERLPTDIQKLYLRQEKILKQNHRDPRLHIKKLKEKPIIYSLRITRSYRAFFYFTRSGKEGSKPSEGSYWQSQKGSDRRSGSYFRASQEVTLFAIGHRKDIYRKL